MLCVWVCMTKQHKGRDREQPARSGMILTSDTERKSSSAKRNEECNMRLDQSVEEKSRQNFKIDSVLLPRACEKSDASALLLAVLVATYDRSFFRICGTSRHDRGDTGTGRKNPNPINPNI